MPPTAPSAKIKNNTNHGLDALILIAMYPKAHTFMICRIGAHHVLRGFNIDPNDLEKRKIETKTKDYLFLFLNRIKRKMVVSLILPRNKHSNLIND